MRTVQCSSLSDSGRPTNRPPRESGSIERGEIGFASRRAVERRRLLEKRRRRRASLPRCTSGSECRIPIVLVTVAAVVGQPSARPTPVFRPPGCRLGAGARPSGDQHRRPPAIRSPLQHCLVSRATPESPVVFCGPPHHVAARHPRGAPHAGARPPPGWGRPCPWRRQQQKWRVVIVPARRVEPSRRRRVAD